MRHDFSSTRTTASPAPPPSLSRAELVLSLTSAVLIGAGLFLGVSKHGQPLVPRARELFVPGGLVLLVVAWRWRRRQPAVSLWIGLAALALIGVGAHEAASGPWTLLAVPGAVVACLACLRSTVRGPRDQFFERMRWARRGSGTRSKPRSVAVTRAWLLFGALMLGVAAELAVASALPPGPAIAVQVVPLAYGGDPPVGTAPNLFGLGVRHAHCSGGATGYTLTIRGETFAMSCAGTSGTRPRTVIVGLRPGHSYAVTIRAVQKRTGQRARTGGVHKLNVPIPAASSKNWRADT